LQRASSTYRTPLWRRVLSSAKVGKSPSGVPEHRNVDVIVEKSQKGCQGVGVKDNVTEAWTVSSNVAQSPHSLDIITTRVSIEPF